MLRFLFFAILAFVAYRLVKYVFKPSKKIEKEFDGKVIDEMVQDPFCKTYIPRQEAIKKTINGQEYTFCSHECASQFKEEIKK